MARIPTAAELRFVSQRQPAVVRAQRPFLRQFVGYVAPPPPAPVNTAPPFVSGNPTVGFALSTTLGAWDNSPVSYARQWLRNGANILIGGAGATYNLVAADAGTNCSCRVTATNPGGSTPAVSNALAVT